MSAGAMRAVKVLVWAACTWPGANLFYNAFWGDLGINPVETLEHTSGEAALVILLCSLAITPVRRITGWNRLQSLRRLLGLWAFFYALAHLSFYILFDQACLYWADCQLKAVVDDVMKRKFILSGMVAFFAMLPRQVARGLKGKHCYEVIELNICKSECIAKQCWADNKHVRLDEISGKVQGDAEAKDLRFILSAVPITDDAGNPVGALEIQRNVTDEAVVQVKYQEMLETEARERERLANQIRVRTKELLETNQLLLKTQKDLLTYKKGLAV